MLANIHEFQPLKPSACFAMRVHPRPDVDVLA